MSKSAQSASRSSAARATAVLLEDIRGQNKVVIEAVQGLGERVGGLEQKVDRLDARVGALEVKVDRLDEKLELVRRELLARIERLEDAVRENSREIRELRAALGAKCDQAALAALELRVTQLERHAGIRPT